MFSLTPWSPTEGLNSQPNLERLTLSVQSTLWSHISVSLGCIEQAFIWRGFLIKQFCNEAQNNIEHPLLWTRRHSLMDQWPVKHTLCLNWGPNMAAPLLWKITAAEFYIHIMYIWNAFCTSVQKMLPHYTVWTYILYNLCVCCNIHLCLLGSDAVMYLSLFVFDCRQENRHVYSSALSNHFHFTSVTADWPVC